MAYQRVNWQQGTKVSDPYVEVDGKRGTYTPGVYSGPTPCNPTSLNIMDEGIKENSDNIDIINNKLNGLSSTGCLYVEDIQCRNLFNKNAITEGVCLNGDGTTREASNFCISDYIPVKMLKKYTYQGLTNVGNETYSEYYSSDKTYISSFQQQTGVNTITIPIGAAYVRFSIRISSSDQDTFQIEPGEVATEYTEYRKIAPIIEDNLDSNSNENIPNIHAVKSYLNDIVKTQMVNINVGVLSSVGASGSEKFDQETSYTIEQGYKCLGIAGYSLVGGYYTACILSRLYADNNKIYWAIRNTGQVQTGDMTLKAILLLTKSSD